MRLNRVFLVPLIALFLLMPFFVLAQGEGDAHKHPSCTYCGMDRNRFAHSRMVIDYENGGSIGVCSINCAALGFIKDIDAAPSSIKVGDYKSKKLINAGTAHWVIGGSRPGVMTERAKWAFQDKSDARSFMRSYGGKSATFDEAMEASYEDIYQDMRMLAQMKLEHARSMNDRNKIGRN